MNRGMLATIAFVAACDGSCGLDLERMIDQPRYSSYEACDVCPDGTIMMQPPQGTVSRTASLGAPAVMRGRERGGYVPRIPITIDERSLIRGKNRFDIYCAPCHGRLGSGISQVAENMLLRPPPSLLAAPYTTYRPGRIFAVITDGFGLMRSYAPQLTVQDRWAVVAYIQALQLSQHIALRELPEPIRQEARSWLK